MQKTVGQLKLDLFRDISPASPDDSRDLNGALQQGVEELLSFTKPKDLSRRVTIENALYDQVNRYSCPDDLDTNKIMQWTRLKNTKAVGDWYTPLTQVTNMDFDQRIRNRNNEQNIFTIEYQSGKKFIKVSDTHNEMTDGYTVHEMNSITQDGTWLSFGNAVNLASDNLTYVSGSGSLRFNLTDSGNIGGIENFDINPFDIHEFLNVGKIFTWVYLPNLRQLQTVTLNLYSSLTDYYSITVNSPHDTDEFQLEWNLLGFELDSSTMNTIGTPNPAAINHIKIEFVTNGTLNMDSIRVDNLVARKGSVYGIQYISNQIFVDAVTGIPKWRPTLDSDIIRLEYDTYQVYRGYCASILGEELVSDKGDVQKIDDKKNTAIAVYKKRHKEEYTEETQALRRFGVEYGQQNRFGKNEFNHKNDLDNN